MISIISQKVAQISPENDPNRARTMYPGDSVQLRGEAEFHTIVEIIYRHMYGQPVTEPGECRLDDGRTVSETDIESIRAGDRRGDWTMDDASFWLDEEEDNLQNEPF